MRTRTTTKLLPALAGAIVAFAIAFDAMAAGSPRLKEVRKIYVPTPHTLGMKHGRPIHVEHGSPKEVREQLVSALVSSGRFAAVTKQADADARLEGAAGYTRSEKDGKKFTTGFAEMKLVDTKTSEVLWVFEYKPQPGAGGSAAARVATQLVERLVADAEAVDSGR